MHESLFQVPTAILAGKSFVMSCWEFRIEYTGISVERNIWNQLPLIPKCAPEEDPASFGPRQGHFPTCR